MRFPGVVDGGFRPDRLAQLVVLLNFRVLVVNVQGRGDPVGDDPGAERPWRATAAPGDQAAAEDQADLVRPADVEVVAQHLLEEDPAGHRGVEHLGEGELRLQDRQLIGVPGVLVLNGERAGQNRQPLAQQRLDVARAEAVADPLQCRHVIHGGEPVVQRLKADAGLGGLPLGPLVAVDAQLGGEREVRAELDEERPEVFIDAVEVEEVDECRGPHQPGVGPAIGVVAALGPPHVRLLLRPAHVQHPLGAGEAGQQPLGDLVLALPLSEVHQIHAASGDEMVDVRDKRLAHRVHQRGRGIGVAAVTGEEARHPAAVSQPRLPHVQVETVDRLDLEPHVIG